MVSGHHPSSSSSSAASGEFAAGQFHPVKTKNLTMDDLYPIAILIDELRSDHLFQRKNAIENLATISLALGPERVREELIPFLTAEVAADDEEELLVELADQVSDSRFVLEFCGGIQYGSCLIPVLEELANKEEAIVRGKATAGLQKIMNLIPEFYKQQAAMDPGSQHQTSSTSLFEEFASLTHRLAQHDWFTSRMSALALLPTIIPISRWWNQNFGPTASSAASGGVDSNGAGEQLQPPDPPEFEYLAAYARLCRDDTPMVRRAAAAQFVTVADVLLTSQGMSRGGQSDSINTGAGISTTPPAIHEQLNQLMQLLAEDEQDSVRVLAIQNAIYCKDKQVLLKSVADKSWRVRYMMADFLPEILLKLFVPGLLKEIEDNDLQLEEDQQDRTASNALEADYVGKILEKLLTDNEPEVRSLAVFKLPSVAKVLADSDAANKQNNGEITPSPISLDTSELAAGGSDNQFPQASQLTTLIQQHLQKLTKDPSQQVRQELSKAVLKLSPYVGKHVTVTILTKIILELIRDESSDVRLQLIQHLPHLAKVIRVSLLNESLLPALQALSCDKQWRVRLAVLECCPVLAKVLGEDVFTEHIWYALKNSAQAVAAGTAASTQAGSTAATSSGDVNTSTTMMSQQGMTTSNNTMPPNPNTAASSSTTKTWLGDPVYLVREAACDSLKKLGNILGTTWTKENVLPEIEKDLISHENYLLRVTAIQAMAKMIQIDPANYGEKDVEEVQFRIADKILSLAEDPVPNVRFNVARALPQLLQALAMESDFLQRRAVETLENLAKSDSDPDVAHFASQSLETVLAR
ncbi:unnamed protein product [Amoebophrya sp. A120]|nr:unnamed protein product [Amoebophrya sp. A120]|eukprot:GSA120T00014530001.1